MTIHSQQWFCRISATAGTLRSIILPVPLSHHRSLELSAPPLSTGISQCPELHAANNHISCWLGSQGKEDIDSLSISTSSKWFQMTYESSKIKHDRTLQISVRKKILKNTSFQSYWDNIGEHDPNYCPRSHFWPPTHFLLEPRLLPMWTFWKWWSSNWRSNETAAVGCRRRQKWARLRSGLRKSVVRMLQVLRDDRCMNLLYLSAWLVYSCKIMQTT